jgi:hypothetical protein
VQKQQRKATKLLFKEIEPAGCSLVAQFLILQKNMDPHIWMIDSYELK